MVLSRMFSVCTAANTPYRGSLYMRASASYWPRLEQGIRRCSNPHDPDQPRFDGEGKPFRFHQDTSMKHRDRCSG